MGDWAPRKHSRHPNSGDQRINEYNEYVEEKMHQYGHGGIQ